MSTQTFHKKLVQDIKHQLTKYKSNSSSQSFQQNQIKKFLYDILQLQQTSIKFIMQEIFNNKKQFQWTENEVIKVILDIQFIVGVNNYFGLLDSNNNDMDIGFMQINISQLINVVYDSCFFVKNTIKKEQVRDLIYQINQKYGNKGYVLMLEYKNFMFSHLIDRYTRKSTLLRKSQLISQAQQHDKLISNMDQLNYNSVDKYTKNIHTDEIIREAEMDEESQNQLKKIYHQQNKSKQFNNVNESKKEKENQTIFSFSAKEFDQGKINIGSDILTNNSIHFISNKQLVRDYSTFKDNLNIQCDFVPDLVSKNTLQSYQNPLNSKSISLSQFHELIWQNLFQFIKSHLSSKIVFASSILNEQIFSIIMQKIIHSIQISHQQKIINKFNNFIKNLTQLNRILSKTLSYLLYILAEERFKVFHNRRVSQEMMNCKIDQTQLQILLQQTYGLFINLNTNEQVNFKQIAQNIIEQLNKQFFIVNKRTITYQNYLKLIKNLSEIPKTTFY